MQGQFDLLTTKSNEEFDQGELLSARQQLMVQINDNLIASSKAKQQERNSSQVKSYESIIQEAHESAFQ